eukprot:scaffold41452_cov65-Phaeocystis_antarctica.AAC.1
MMCSCVHVFVCSCACARERACLCASESASERASERAVASDVPGASSLGWAGLGWAGLGWAVGARVDGAEAGAAGHPPAAVRVEHRRDHARQRHLGLVVQVAQRLDRRQRVGPQLGELVHVGVDLLVVREAGQVRIDLAEELGRREGEARYVVHTLRLAQLRLGRHLQRGQPAHQVVHEDHRELHVEIDRALKVLPPRRGEHRVERILRGAVAPHGLGMQHARQNRDPRVAAVAIRKLVEQVPARTLLKAVVAAGVLRRVVDEPARGDILSWRGESERTDRVGEADAPAADTLHRTKHVLHPADDNLLRNLGAERRLDRERRREVPHGGIGAAVLFEQAAERALVAHIHSTDTRLRHLHERGWHHRRTIRGDHLAARPGERCCQALADGAGCAYDDSPRHCAHVVRTTLAVRPPAVWGYARSLGRSLIRGYFNR